MKEWKAAGLISKSTNADTVFDANASLDLLRRSEVAFLGWLFSDPIFLKEVGELNDASVFRPDGPPVWLPGAATDFATSMSDRQADIRSTTSVDERAAIATFNFCVRWRLTRVMGPRTFIPLSVQFPAPLPHLIAPHVASGGAFVFIPDIAPLPERDQLRALVESARTASTAGASHLQKWFELVEADTQGRKALTKYERWYAYQHYLRLLFERHGSALRTAMLRVDNAFSSFFGQSAESIRRDRREIAARLGANWWLQPVIRPQ